LTSIAFSPTNRWVAGGLADGRVLVWNLGTTERIDLARPDGETGELRFVSEEVLGSKSPDTTLVVWSLPNRRSHVLRGHVGIAHWARRFDGTIVTFGHEGEIRAWTLPDARDRSLRSHSGPVAHVAYSAHGLVTAGSDGDVRVWPPDEHEDDRLVSDENDPVVTFAVAPRGDRVAIGRANGDVAITELGGNKATALAQTGQVFGVAWDREGRRLAIAGRSGGVDVVDTMTGETSLEIREPDAYRVRAAHFSRGGRVLATVGWVDDGIVWIRMFDARTGALQEKHPVEATGVEAAAFSHDDRYVAINSFERTVLVWDRHSGVRTFGKHAGQVGGVDISPDSSRLITAGTDGVVKLWDLASGLHRTVQLRGPLRGVAFALDGKTFTAVGDARVAFFGRDDLPQDPAQLRAWVLRATNMRVQPSDLDLDGSSL
jgi:WD40 repeat protein